MASSKYRSGRSKTWLKTKCFTESAFLIIGTARDRKTGAALTLLARAEPEGLTYVGSAFIALAGNERDKLGAYLEVNKVGRCAIAKFRFPYAKWVKPEIVARVRHLAGTIPQTRNAQGICLIPDPSVLNMARANLLSVKRGQT